MRPVLLSALLLSLAAAAPARAADLSAPTFPVGLLDHTGRTAYLASPQGGIDAVDLMTGDVIWQTSEAQVPLLAAGDRLYAQAGVKRNRLRVLAFDLSRRGECVLETDSVVLPAWVVAGYAPGRSFEARWRLERTELVLAWEARAWFTGGRPTPEQEKAARKQAAGTARIDLATGQVRLGEPEKTTPPAKPRVPRQLEKLSVRWHGVVGRHLLAVGLENVPPPPGSTARLNPSTATRKLVLYGWDRQTGKPIKKRDLLPGRQPEVLASLDGRFLCLRDTAPPPDELLSSVARQQLNWHVYSLEKNEYVGRIPYTPGANSVLVKGKRAYFVVAGPMRGPLDRPSVRPRSLRAVELATGTTVWERPVAGKALNPPGR
jgi:hypothetical protein